MQIVHDYENKRPPSLDLFLAYLGLTEDEFWEIALSHSVSPYSHEPNSTAMGKKTWDYTQWPRHRFMNREETMAILDRWRVGRRGESVEKGR